jgi:hypothetical protein
MTEPDPITAEIEGLRQTARKLASRASQAKLDLHDLAEDLPIDWERIPEVSQRAYETQAALAEARASLATAEEQCGPGEGG